MPTCLLSCFGEKVLVADKWNRDFALCGERPRGEASWITGEY